MDKNKPLREHTTSELREVLDNNENQSPSILAFVCSEILRRLIKRQEDCGYMFEEEKDE